MSTSFERRPIDSDDVNGETWVRIWDAHRVAPFAEGKVIAYADRPTAVIEQADGKHSQWIASLPWERIPPPEPPMSTDTADRIVAALRAAGSTDNQRAAGARALEVSRAEDWKRIRHEVENDPAALTRIINELRSLWLRCLEREGRLAGAVADVMWRAQPYGETEDGDTFAYLVTKGAMHRLIAAAQQNGAGVSVAFQARRPDTDYSQPPPLAPAPVVGEREEQP